MTRSTATRETLATANFAGEWTRTPWTREREVVTAELVSIDFHDGAEPFRAIELHSRLELWNGNWRFATADHVHGPRAKDTTFGPRFNSWQIPAHTDRGQEWERRINAAA